MTNESSTAEEGLFALDPDDQDAAADTNFDENEEVPEVHDQDQDQDQEQTQAQGGLASSQKRTTVLTKSELKFLRIMKRRARFLDKSIWSSLLTAFPFAGDALHIAFSYILIVRPAVKAKIPRPLRQRMMANLAAAALIGLMPLAGPRYGPSQRNVKILEIYLIKRGKRAVANAAQSAAPQEEMRRDTGGDVNLPELPEGEKGDERQEGAVEVSEEKPGPANAANTSDGDKEKNATTTEDVKDENTIAAPDSAADPEKATHLRPPRNTAEYVQHRDSRFIEDVS